MAVLFFLYWPCPGDALYTVVLSNVVGGTALGESPDGLGRQCRIYGGGGHCDMFPPLGAEGAFMNGRRPDPLHAVSVYITASFLVEVVLIHEIRTISPHKTPAIKN